MITSSDTIGAISKALTAAASEIGGARKDAKNPHFKSQYATLESVIDAAREPLRKNKLFVMQSPGAIVDGSIQMRTRIIHESGEWIETLCEVPLGKRDPQGVGSAQTYARRYAYAALLSIPAVDDDGEAAMPRGQQAANQSQAPRETIDTERAALIDNAIKEVSGDRDAILRHFKVESLVDLTPQQADALDRQIAQKRAAAKEVA